MFPSCLVRRVSGSDWFLGKGAQLGCSDSDLVKGVNISLGLLRWFPLWVADEMHDGLSGGCGIKDGCTCRAQWLLHAPTDRSLIHGRPSVMLQSASCIFPAVWFEALFDSLQSSIFTGHLALFGKPLGIRWEWGVHAENGEKTVNLEHSPRWHDTKTPN